MDKIFDLLFALIRCAIHGGEPDKDALADLNEAEWSELFNAAHKTRMAAVLYPVLEKCGAFGEKNAAVQEKWKTSAKSAVLGQMEITRAVYAIRAESVKREIAPVFIKGAVLADLYPHYSQRRSGDIDILVTDGEKDAAMRMLEEMGYKQSQEGSKNHVQVYYSGNPRSVIELHTRLWEDYEGQKIDILESLRLEENRVSVKACGFDITTLEPTGHLIYQIFHIVKHFILDGIGARYLVDVALFIEKYKEQIDFEIFRKSIEALGYTQFCKQFFNLCGVYVGLDISFFTEDEPVIDADAQSLMFDIIGGGVAAGVGDQWQIMGIMTPYFVGEKKARRTSFGRKLDAIFLRPKDLQGKFIYAQKYKILLPVAWVHRGIEYLRQYSRRKDHTQSAGEKLKLTEHRLHLLNRLGLVNEKE